MYQIDINESEIKTTFVFHGSINSLNAQEIDSFILGKVKDKSNVVFDFGDVEYISSAGLRIILKIGKLIPEFEIINVKSDVYEIFNMTGFTEILKISKGLREISIEGKELIGEGYMGRVYRLDPETIIKVYYRNSSIEDIKKEIRLAKTAFVLGIPTAIPFDVVKVKEGSYGSIFELLNSECFNQLFIKHPEKTEEYISLYISLLKEIIAIRVKDVSALPHKIDDAWKWYYDLEKRNCFIEEDMKKIKHLISTIPDDNHIIHGDYHIKNIMMQGNEPLLIDMDTLGVGHEIFEFSAFFLTYIGYPSTDPNNCKEFLGIDDNVCKHLFKRTIDEVFVDKSELEREQIVDKLAILGYFWLTYKTYLFEPNNLKRLEHSKQEVIRLIKKVDTLAF